MNKQYSKEDYEKEMEEVKMSDYSHFQLLKKKFLEFIHDAKYLYIRRNGRLIDSSGDFLTNVENCFECFDLSDAKDCKYVQGGFDLKDMHDGSYVSGELGYENCECVPMPMHSSFNLNSYTGNDLHYCDTCMNGNKDLFGCVSLKHEEYCILNKKYSKEEYEELVPKIIAHMKEKGEWGEFMPSKHSPFAYNETNANEYFPLEKEKAIEEGYKWKENDPKEFQPAHDDVLACEDCNKNYKIIKQESVFYEKMHLPIPKICPDCRHKEREIFRNNRKLWGRKCTKCSTDVKTTYSEDRSEKIYCEKCYLDEVY